MNINNEMKKFEEICKENNLRITHQRLEIYKALLLSEIHPSVEDIYKTIITIMPTISLDTVYRTIETFEELGIIARLEVLDDRRRFDANMSPHRHFVCLSCKKIIDLDWPEFGELEVPEIAIKGLGEIIGIHAEVRGVCYACLGKNVNA